MAIIVKTDPRDFEDSKLEVEEWAYEKVVPEVGELAFVWDLEPHEEAFLQSHFPG